MPDIHDMTLDAMPSMSEIFDCVHTQTEYQPCEQDTNTNESYNCIDCGEELPMPEPIEDRY